MTPAGILILTIILLCCTALFFALIYRYLSRIDDENARTGKISIIKTCTEVSAALFVTISGVMALWTFLTNYSAANEAQRASAEIAESEQFSRAATFYLDPQPEATEAGTAILRRLLGSQGDLYAEGIARLTRGKITNLQSILLQGDISEVKRANLTDQIYAVLELHLDASTKNLNRHCLGIAPECDKSVDLSFISIPSFRGRSIQDYDVRFYDEATGIGAYIPYADFYGIDASGVDFTHTVLTEASFVEATVSSAIFSHSELTGAKFAGADATNTTFLNARLVEARLIGARLHCSDLRSADLSGATIDLFTLTGAEIFAETVLPEIIDREIIEQGDQNCEI